MLAQDQMNVGLNQLHKAPNGDIYKVTQGSSGEIYTTMPNGDMIVTSQGGTTTVYPSGTPLMPIGPNPN